MWRVKGDGEEEVPRSSFYSEEINSFNLGKKHLMFTYTGDNLIF